MRSVKVLRSDKGVATCMRASVKHKNSIILQVKASWQCIRGCIHAAEHARNNDRALSTLIHIFALAFVASAHVDLNCPALARFVRA